MQCIRIFGAYFYRLSRKHSTALLIAILIISITLILEMYVHRHRKHPSLTHVVGDFDYQPGSYLQGQQPNENVSYCLFNYGLPNELQPGSYTDHPPPETGESSSYRIIYNAIEGTAYSNLSTHDTVTYVTQSTPEFIYHIIEIARYWDGPISFSVYVPDYDLDIAMQIIDQLCHCSPAMAKVSLHLFYPKKFPPKSGREQKPIPIIKPTIDQKTAEEILRMKQERYRTLNNETRAAYIQRAIKSKIEKMVLAIPTKRIVAPYLSFKDCSGLDSYDIATFRKESRTFYPINVGRNSARKATRTDYFVVSDIEMVPSDNLVPRFIKMIKNFTAYNKGKRFSRTVFVVPLFEVERGEAIPRNKETLVEMVAANRAMYFHKTTCSHCQRFPGLQRWLSKPSTNTIEPMLMVRREYPFHRWEPLYIGTQQEPWYSEMLSWDGRQDKMTQMVEMCLQQYFLVILDGGFFCHAASPNKSVVNPGAKKVNDRHYTKIINSFKVKYPFRSQCKLFYGC